MSFWIVVGIVIVSMAIILGFVMTTSTSAKQGETVWLDSTKVGVLFEPRIELYKWEDDTVTCYFANKTNTKRAVAMSCIEK